MGMWNIVFKHPTSGQTAEAAVDSDHTPQDIIDCLIEEHFLASLKPETAYGVMNTRTEMLLDPNSTFVPQNIQDKDRLKITIEYRSVPQAKVRCHRTGLVNCKCNYCVRK